MSFDEIDQTCWFCKDRPSGGMNADHAVWVRAPADYQGSSQQTVWDERGVTLARCNTCRNRHAMLKNISKSAWILAGLCFVAYLFWDDQWDTSPNTVYIAIALCLGSIAMRILFSTLQRLLGTQPESAAKKHHEVKKFLDRGAQLGRAPKH